jgi:4-amino-4-deoxy-L-arabinose transferase-like glycosyltransferase
MSVFSAEQKTKIVLEVFQSDSTLNQIASKYEIAPKRGGTIFIFSSPWKQYYPRNLRGNMTETYKKYIYTIGFIFIVFSAVFAGSKYMNVDLMEARNFVTAREMLSNHNWLIPTMNGELRIAKPPLPTWATALSMLIANTDTNLFANRLPAGIAALLMVYFMYAFTMSVSRSKDTSIYASLILSTSYMFMYMARKGTWDIFAHSFMLGAIWIYHDALINDVKKLSNYTAAGILMALSWMSKGPVAFYALLLPFIISQIAVYRGALFRGRLKQILLMIIVCASVSAIWPAYLMFHASEFAQATVAGEATAWFSRHIKPFWYYLQFPAMAGVWMFILIPMLNPKYADKKVSDTKIYRLMLIWTIAIVVLLSIIPEKKDRYLLPVTVPMSVIISYYLRYLVNAFKKEQLLKDDKRIIGIYLILNMILSGLTACAVVYEFMHSGFSDVFFILTIASLLANFAIYRSIRHKSGRSFVFSFVASFIVLINVVPPLAQEVAGKKDFMQLQEVRQIIPKDNAFIYTSNDNMKLVWAVGQRMQYVNSSEVYEKVSGYYLAEDIGFDKTFDRLHTVTNDQGKTRWALYKISNYGGAER